MVYVIKNIHANTPSPAITPLFRMKPAATTINEISNKAALILNSLDFNHSFADMPVTTSYHCMVDFETFHKNTGSYALNASTLSI